MLRRPKILTYWSDHIFRIEDKLSIHKITLEQTHMNDLIKKSLIADIDRIEVLLAKGKKHDGKKH